MSFAEFLAFHEANRSDDLRLGQRFVTRYIRSPWPGLFYLTDESLARQMIKEWLEQYHYWPDMPTPIATR